MVLQQSYIGNNWPVMHVAANEDGTHLAIAGRQGLILYDFQSKRWRVFGDITQEREIQCVGLVWLGRIIVLCNYREVTKTWVLLFHCYGLFLIWGQSRRMCYIFLCEHYVAMLACLPIGWHCSLTCFTTCTAQLFDWGRVSYYLALTSNHVL